MSQPLPSNENQPTISVSGVSKRFSSAGGDTVTALSGVSMQVQPHSFVSIVGPSGCGKTTLLSILAGLTDWDEGQVEIGGQPVSGPRDDTGMVFQKPVLLPWKTILGNVLLPVAIRGGAPKPYERTARDLLALVGLRGFENHLPHELSGGMQQRVAIARSLILDPQLLLMDEPFGALDAITREQMNLELARIWEQQRKVVVLVTHSIQESVFLSDQIVVMSPRPGRIVDIVPVDIPRPRSLEVMETTAFAKTAALVRRLLEGGAASTPNGGTTI